MADAARATTPEVPKLSLRQKLLAVMRDLESVEERGENKAQGYRYTMASDVILAARRAFVKHGIIFNASEVSIVDGDDSTTRSGAIMKSVRVTMGYLFLDTDTDDQLYVTSTGEGQDTGDKAIYKAKTGALKYALQNNLLLAAGDDAEDDKGEEELVERSSRPLRVVQDHKCPKCGKVGSLVRNRATGVWQCWRSKGGCESVFDEAQLAEFEQQREQVDTSSEQAAPPPEDAHEERMTERIVATEDMLQPLVDLIKESSDAKATEAAILSRCGVKKLSDLTPKQVEWQVSTLQKKLEARNANKRPRK